MPQVEIHNGQILEDGEPVQSSPSPRPQPAKGGQPVEDVEPEAIAGAMAACISLGIDSHLTPMEIVNSLLTLNSGRGHKLVWTRFDVHQAFALWTRKMDGRGKL